METAAAGVINGLDTTIVFPESHLMSRLLPEELASHYEELYESKGVKFLKGPVVQSFSPDSSGEKVGKVLLSDGQELEADLVIVGIGAFPVTGAFNSAGLAMAERPIGGIQVDSKMRTSAPDIWAVGDVAAFPLKRKGGKLVRFEHVDNARRMAASAVSAMLDPAGSPEYDYLPYFYSRVFEQPGSDRKVWWQFFGEADGTFVKVGDFKPKVAGFWVSPEDGALNGAFLESGTPEEFGAVRAAVTALAQVSIESLRASKSVEEAIIHLSQ